MEHISGFFSRFLSNHLRFEQKKILAAGICSDILHTTVSPDIVRVQKDTCFISGDQSLKHQIFLFQHQILERFAQTKELQYITRIQ
jgi:hypothetical protein